MEPLLRILTFNLRTATADAVDAPRGNDWARRRSVAQALLTDLNPDVLGFQEAHEAEGQTSALLAVLPGYRCSQHEELALLWNPNRVEALDGGAVTLGVFGHPDPWGPRWVQWQRFRVVATGKPLLVVNTHLSVEADHEPQARQVFDVARTQGRDQPALVMGDFNFDASGLLNQYGFADAVPDHGGTFHDFLGGRDNPRLDFLATKGLAVSRAGVDTRSERQDRWEVYPSDHYPVWVEAAPLDS